ncbi:MAG: LpqB family beta-propeller domain-containing protein [Actinomycetota bacterium]|nr:LpqB family beta-propeller domain-containing protein [Actinomycetota bacterium]
MTGAGSDTATCARHGTATRLTCVECGTPICPQCLLRTPVGLKCPDHAEQAPAGVSPRKRGLSGPALAGLAVLGAAAAVVVLSLALGGEESTDTSDQGGPALPSPDRIRTPQLTVMASDGTAKRVLTNRPLAFDGNPAWSPDGSRIAFESLIEGRRSIWVIQANGEGLRRLTDGEGTDSAPAWSPDGSTIAFTSDRDGNAEIYAMGADGSDVRRLTTDPSTDAFPTWSPDGSRIAFVSDRDGVLKLWTMGADASDPSRLLDIAAEAQRPGYSGDGRRVVFSSDRDGNPEIYAANVDGSGLTRLTDKPGADGEASFSPDGSRIAFASDRDGSPSVFVMAADGASVTKLTTGPLGYSPAWSPDGRSIAYVSDAGAPGPS